MADLTTRTALSSTPDKDDLVHIVDISDTTDSGAGTSKKITAGNLVGRILLETIVADGSTITAFDFTSIPSGFNRIRGHGFFQSSRPSTDNDGVAVQLNGDTTASNYRSQRQTSIGATESAVGDNTNYLTTCAAAASEGKSKVEFLIEGYAETGLLKSVWGFADDYRSSGSIASFQPGIVYHNTLTAAITSVKLLSTNGVNFTGTMRLYLEM